MSEVGWDADNIAHLKKLYAAGFSSSQIAREIPYATRNAVIGKISRLGLTRTNGQQRKKSKPKPAKTGTPYHLRRFQTIKAASDPVLIEMPAGHVGVSFAENTGCKWSLDAGTFCGLTTEAVRRPYCAAHAAMAIRK